MEYQPPGFFERISRKLQRIAARKWKRTALSIPADFRGVSFCFDDFPIEAAAGAKILEDAGLRGTFYVCFGMLGEKSDSGTLASLEQVLSVTKKGHEIGCHTFDHILCCSTGAKRIENSCRKNRETALKHGLSLHNFAYPEGELNPWTKNIIKNHYRTGRSVVRGINQGKIDAHHLKATPLYETDPQNIRDLLDQLETEGGWLILCTHDVAAPPSQYGTSCAFFSELVALCLTKNIPVRTVDDTVNLFRNEQHGH